MKFQVNKGLFRSEELLNIRVPDIDWFDDHFVVHVPESKTDIYRRGQVVFIAKPSGDSCLAVLLDRYIYTESEHHGEGQWH